MVRGQGHIDRLREALSQTRSAADVAAIRARVQAIIMDEHASDLCGRAQDAKDAGDIAEAEALEDELNDWLMEQGFEPLEVDDYGDEGF